MKYSTKHLLLAGFAASLATVSHAQDAPHDSKRDAQSKSSARATYALFIENVYQQNLRTNTSSVFTIYQKEGGGCTVVTNTFQTAEDMRYNFILQNGTDSTRVTKRVKIFSLADIDKAEIYGREKRDAFMNNLPKCRQN